MKPPELLIDAKTVRLLLDYDKYSGAFSWLPRDRSMFADNRQFNTWNSRFAHARAGHQRADGYVCIRVLTGSFLAHRLAWLHTFGHWPTAEVDHINGNPIDNRIENLRDVSHKMNGQNVRKPSAASTTKVLGVYQRPSGRFAASIHVDGRGKAIGLFGSPEEAHEAYVKAKRALHPGNTL